MIAAFRAARIDINGVVFTVDLVAHANMLGVGAVLKHTHAECADPECEAIHTATSLSLTFLIFGLCIGVWYD